jgi:hypothetical protein
MLYSSPAWFVTAMLTAMFRCPDHNTEQSESLEIPAFSVVKLLHYCTRAGSLQSGTTAEGWARCSTSECVLLSMLLWTVQYHYGCNVHTRISMEDGWISIHCSGTHMQYVTHLYSNAFWCTSYPCNLVLLINNNFDYITHRFKVLKQSIAPIWYHWMFEVSINLLNVTHWKLG